MAFLSGLLAPFGGGPVAGGVAGVSDGERQLATRRSLTEIAARQVRPATIANFVAAAGTAGVLWPVLPPFRIVLWLLFMMVVGVVRLRTAARVRAAAASSELAVLDRQVVLMAGLAGMNGLVWGVLGSALVPLGEFELRAFTACVVVGMAAGAVVSHAALPAAGRLFVLAALLPGTVSYLVGPMSRTDVALAILSLVYAGALFEFMRGTSGALVDAVSARLSNERLAAEVADSNARLTEAIAAAEAASEAKSRFLATMSHEIRTPMNGVLGIAGTLLDTPLTADQTEAVEAIRNSGDTLLRLLNDILDFSRLDAGRMQLEEMPFGPGALTEHTVSLLAAQAAAKGLRLEAVCDAGLPVAVLGDAGRLRQVLLNLMSNAVKFTEKGGVTVRAECLPAAPGLALVRWSVEDTGIGIPADRIGHLFTEFTQADASITRRFGGTGLGLAISRKLIEEMGGAIAVRSRPGEGTVFEVTLTLPLTTPAAATADVLADASADLVRLLEGLGRPARVLFAEDNATNRFVALRMLRGFSLQIDTVGNGIEAVQAAASLPYDVICMDLRMPEMDGLTATREIRGLGGALAVIPIIALTANVMPDDVAACFEAGMTGFVPKPVSRESLVGALLASLGGGEIGPVAQDEDVTVAVDEEGLARLRRDIGPASVTRLLGRFVEETRASLGRIADPGLDDAARADELHALKGVAGTVCAPLLSALAGGLQRRAERGEGVGTADLAELGAAFDAWCAATSWQRETAA